MSLLEKRIEFTNCVFRLGTFANSFGFKTILDQAMRTEREARWNAEHCAMQLADGRCEREHHHSLHGSEPHQHTFRPIGIINSTHRSGLAIDMYLIAYGKISNEPSVYALLGEYWKSLHPLARWGGDFMKEDLGHFSFEHNGRQ